MIALNVYGESAESPVGNGAVILTVPSAPESFVENYSDRTATTLGFTWVDGESNGGSNIQDYTISYDQGSNNYVSFENGIFGQAYVATGLTPGRLYKFKV